MNTKDLAVLAARQGLTVDVTGDDGRWVTGLDHERCRETAGDGLPAWFFVRDITTPVERVVWVRADCPVEKMERICKDFLKAYRDSSWGLEMDEVAGAASRAVGEAVSVEEMNDRIRGWVKAENPMPRGGWDSDAHMREFYHVWDTEFARIVGMSPQDLAELHHEKEGGRLVMEADGSFRYFC